MSRFAVIYEDPTYEEPVVSESWADLLDGYVTTPPPQDIMDWLDEQLA
jgi:hypothetical protein